MQPSGAGELLTQLQDQLDALSRLFFEVVGVLQRDAPPVSVTGEALVAQPPAPGFDMGKEVQAMAKQIMEQVQRTGQLLHLLPDSLGSNGSSSQAAAAGGGGDSGQAQGGYQQQDAFTHEVKGLQQEHQAVSQELAGAVEEVEGLLLQLQQLYAALAQAKLQAQFRAS